MRRPSAIPWDTALRWRAGLISRSPVRLLYVGSNYLARSRLGDHVCGDRIGALVGQTLTVDHVHFLGQFEPAGRLFGGSMNIISWKGCLPYLAAMRIRSSSMLLHADAIPTSIQMCSVSFFRPY
jgi:hypothetical protein